MKRPQQLVKLTLSAGKDRHANDTVEEIALFWKNIPLESPRFIIANLAKVLNMPADRTLSRADISKLLRKKIFLIDTPGLSVARAADYIHIYATPFNAIQLATVTEIAKTLDKTITITSSIAIGRTLEKRRKAINNSRQIRFRVLS
jgi:hypothetical protein